MSRLSPGTVIDGRYRIEHEIASGGMGQVYRATHMKLGKTVALKVMSAELADDPEFRRRFESEARAVAEINHDHVIDVSDFGEYERGLYIVMRYIRGSDLRTILRRRGPLEPRRAVQITEEVASALDAAHERGLLHRDVKPGNILVEESSSRIYLADFGLVRSARGEDSTMTGGRVLASPWYMAPERQWHQETKLVDVYSLGCVLWELLVGPDPEKPRPSDPPGRWKILPELRAVVERALAERPGLRFPSAGELARAARQALGPQADQGQLIQGGAATTTAVFHEPLSTDLRAQVRKLCDDAVVKAADPAARAELERVRNSLVEPLVVAVVGRVGAGKSALVGALAGRRIAPPTGAPPTWYREVDLELTIVETPGLGSLAPSEAQAASRQASEEQEAVSRAEALLFATAADTRGADREALEAFRQRFGSSGRPSALNSIAVLTKPDRVPGGSGPEPGAEQAQELRAQLRPLVHAVVPVSGLLAQAAGSGALSERDVDQLLRLAALGEEKRERLLSSAEAFVSDTAPIDGVDRRRLLALLGLYGVRRVLELAHAGDIFNPTAVVKHLRELSGIDVLREQIDAVKLRADMLKADAALTELEAFAWRHGIESLRSEIDGIRLEHPLLDLLRAYDDCAAARIELKEGMVAELEQLLTGRTLAERLGRDARTPVAELRELAKRRAAEWRLWSGSGLASFRGRQLAGKVDDVYTQIAFPASAIADRASLR
ncbi:MAG: protein kinase domain-containing protein [Solirubrobacteraceae bacterium]